jgi:L-lactate dehydrogenase
MSSPFIAVIGAGNVGSTTAYTLLRSQCAGLIGLADIDNERCEGQCLDLADSSTQAHASTIVHIPLEEARHADIIIIAAGKPQKPGQSRLDLCAHNCHLVQTISNILHPINPHAHLIVVTNPVDVLTTLFIHTKILPAHRIFGTGTYLDTQRLRIHLAQQLNISATMIHGFVLGEHGDSQFIPWQYVTIQGIPLSEFPLSEDIRAIIAQKTCDKAYQIIQQKHATYFGIAACIDELCHAIIYNRRIIAPLSWIHQRSPISLSLPVILGADGIEPTITLPLTPDQESLLQKSAQNISRILEGA